MVGKALSAVGGLSSLAYLSADPEPSCREPYTNDVFNVTGQYLFAGLAQTGISKHGCMSPSDAHSVLGLPYNASKEEVKQAYRKLCLLHHPDLCPPDKRAEAESTFKLITEAYSKLASGDTRQWTGSTARQGVTRQRSTYTWHRAPAARSSNGLVALVFCLPLVLAGVHVAMNRGGRSDLGDGTRPHGLLNPPVNPWLADRYKPRQRIRGASSLEGSQS